MNKPRVLFLCVHNSARSQMAEAFLKKYAGDRFEVMSAGIEPGKLNPVVVEAMSEIGIDISQNQTTSVFDLYKQNFMFTYVVTVCSKEAAEKCPVFLGVTTRLHWPFDDPSSFTGTREEKLDGTRKVRDQIEAKVQKFIATIDAGKDFNHEDKFIINP